MLTACRLQYNFQPPKEANDLIVSPIYYGTLCYSIIKISIIIYLQVSGEFILTVNLVNYTNPTGLCAECHGLMPVCCDELPFISGNCTNTGDKRCDTRFRWTLRPFGATLETRPSMGGYFFTDCTMSPSTCPFNETSTAFGQGPTALLGVTPNPLPVSKTDILSWTVSLCSFHLSLHVHVVFLCIGTNTVLLRSSR